MGQSKKYSNTTTLLICMYIHTYILALCFSKMTYCFSLVWCPGESRAYNQVHAPGWTIWNNPPGLLSPQTQEDDGGHLVDNREHTDTVPPLMTLEMPHRSAGLAT